MTLVEEVGPLREAAAAPRIDPEQVNALAARAHHAEGHAALLEAQLAEVVESHGAELAELELLLHQRGGAIASLERELVRREAIVRELVAALQEAGEAGEPDRERGEPSPHAAHAQAIASEAIAGLQSHLRTAVDENVDLRAKLDALALEVARREGELQARAWRVAELEERVASFESRPAAPPPVERPSSESPPPSLPSELDALRAELSALRQALAQEHEARVRAESGEELSRARADLARQAALLEQLARELEARVAGQSADRVQP
jgi:hypothetical protein